MPRHPMEYQVPTTEQLEKIQFIRGYLRTIYDAITNELPSSRERSLALTKIEECSMWVNKAAVFPPEGS